MNYMQEELMQTVPENSLLAVDTFIGKSYLAGLDSQPVLPLEENLKNFDDIRLFKVEKIVFDKEENINDKLISVYSAIQSINSSVFLLIDSNGTEISFYIGIRSSEGNPHVAGQILYNSFKGNFPGSELTNLKGSEISHLLSSITDTDEASQKRLSNVAVTPSARDNDKGKGKEKFVQGIEKFIDAMSGTKYSSLIIASPLSGLELNMRKKGLEDLYSSLSPFIKKSMAYGENYSFAISQGLSDSFSESLNDSISNCLGTNSNENYSESVGKTENYDGFFSSGSNSRTTGSSHGYGHSQSETKTHGRTVTNGESRNYSETGTEGTSTTVTLELKNKTIEAILQKIDLQLKRINDCESFGIWECAAYFISDNIETSVIAASTYKSLMLGDETHIEKTNINIWQEPGDAIEYLRYGMHPRFLIESDSCINQIIRPVNIVSGKELPYLMGIPRKSIDGLTVNSIAEFGRNIFRQNSEKNGRKIRIGVIQHMGKAETNRPVELNLDSFTSHCFVTGSTGSGKSNTTYCLLSQFIDNKIPFLVIEPAKGEYKFEFGNLDGINIFTTNPYLARMLKINPFRFNPKIHVLEHLDRLIEIFNVCWEMYAAMPAILKAAIEQAYIDVGWDLLNSTYVGEGEPRYPTFNDLVSELHKIITSSSYSAESKGDYEGALVTRVQSLTNGIYGNIFCDCYDIADETLFEENTIIDLSRVGSSETKSLIMGILVLKLSEHRMANANGANSKLRHITVMEEAHNLLKNTQNSTSGNNIMAKSVEMITNSIAEMRTYGEGFVIVDQSPTSVDISAIKNTNTKILMRLPEKKDSLLAGQSVALNDAQIGEMSKLETGVAIVMQNNWLESVLVKIDKSSASFKKEIQSNSLKEIKGLRKLVLTDILSQFFYEKNKNEREIDKKRLFDIIKNYAANNYVNADMQACIESIPEKVASSSELLSLCNIVVCLSGAKFLLSKLDKNLIVDAKTRNIEKSVCEKWQQLLFDGLTSYTDISDYHTLNRLGKLVTRYATMAERNRNKYITLYKMLYEKS